jgi:hypothetical protein
METYTRTNALFIVIVITRFVVGLGHVVEPFLRSSTSFISP